MTPVQNDLQWPSIDQFVQQHTYFLLQHIKTCTQAAANIQRVWRMYRAYRLGEGDGGDNPLKTFQGAPVRAVDYITLLDTPCIYTSKLDGTNFGVEYLADSGFHRLLGRRLEVTGEEYQKVPLSHIKEQVAHLDLVAHLRTQLGLDIVGGKNIIKRAVMYGELMSNRSKLYGFDYGRFYPYGIILELVSGSDEVTKSLAVFHSHFGIEDVPSESHDTGREDPRRTLSLCMSSLLRKNGFIARAMHTGSHVLVSINDRLVQALGELGLSTIPPNTSTIERLLLDKADSLVNLECEGYVVCVGHSLSKWKNPVEPQSKNIKILQKITAFRDQHPLLLHTRWHPVLDALMRAASDTRNDKKPTKTRQVRIPSKPVIDPDALHDALQSALTKYDTMETYFAQGSEQRAWILTQLLKECMEDLEVKEEEVLRYKELKKDVAKFVGQAYGRYLHASKNS